MPPPTEEGRKPFLLVGSALTSIFVIGVVALVISLAVNIRPTVDQRPDPGQSAIIPSAAPPAPGPAIEQAQPALPPPPAETIKAPIPVVQEAPAPAARRGRCTWLRLRPHRRRLPRLRRLRLPRPRPDVPAARGGSGDPAAGDLPAALAAAAAAAAVEAAVAAVAAGTVAR